MTIITASVGTTLRALERAVVRQDSHLVRDTLRHLGLWNAMVKDVQGPAELFEEAEERIMYNADEYINISAIAYTLYSSRVAYHADANMYMGYTAPALQELVLGLHEDGNTIHENIIAAYADEPRKQEEE